MNVRLAQAVMRVRNIGIVLQSLQIFGNRLSVMRLIGIEIAQLKVCFGELGIERNGLCPRRADGVDASSHRRVFDCSPRDRNDHATGRNHAFGWDEANVRGDRCALW